MKKTNKPKRQPIFAMKRRRIFFDEKKAKAEEERMLQKMKDVEYPIGKKIKREFFEPKKREKAKPRVDQNFILNTLKLKKEDLNQLFKQSRQVRKVKLPPIKNPQRKNEDDCKENKAREMKPFRIRSGGIIPPKPKEDSQDKFRNLQGFRNLEIFDYFEETMSPEEWVDQCQKSGEKSHARCPVFRDQEYKWVEVEVLAYDSDRKRFQVKEVVDHSQTVSELDLKRKPIEKWVKRLSLCFHNESFESFKKRIEKCKLFMMNAKNQETFAKIVREVPTPSVSNLPQKFVNKIYRKVFPENVSDKEKKVNNDLYYMMITKVKDEFKDEMKKLHILDKAKEEEYRKLLEERKINLKEIDPFFREGIQMPFKNHFLRKMRPGGVDEKLGLIGKPKMSQKFRVRVEKLRAQPVMVNPELLRCVKMFTKRSAVFAQTRLLNFDGVEKHPPFELKNFMLKQEDKFKTNKLSLNSQWREQNIGDITDLLREMDEFSESFKHVSVYNSPNKDTLKRFLGRIDLKFKEGMLTLLEKNIGHYLHFLGRYVIPSELSTEVAPEISPQPLIFIQLKFNEQEKKKKDRKKKGNLIFLEPNLPTMVKKLQAPVNWLTEMVNEQLSMERDIVKMLNLPKKPLVRIQEDDEFVLNAKEKIKRMIERGFKEPKKILKKFKKYDFLLERSKEEILKSFFDSKKEKKKSLTKVESYLDKLEQSILEIEGICAENHKGVFFEIRTKELKRFLIEKATKVKEMFFKKISSETNKNIVELRDKYSRMKTSLTMEPQNEKEYITLKKNLSEMNKNMSRLEGEMEETKSMIQILEKFNQEVNHKILIQSWLLYISPLEIKGAFHEGKIIIDQKEYFFKNNLEEEKAAFIEELERIELIFENFIKINSIDNISNSAERNENLKDKIKESLNKVQNFNEREELFGLARSEYFVLDNLKREYEPYRDLWDVTFQFTNDRDNWDMHILFKLNYHEVVKKMDSHRRKIRGLEQTFEELEAREALKVVRKVQDKIALFSKNLPVIEWLTKESIVKKINNWKTLFTGLGIQSNPNTESLNSLMNQNILARMEDVKEFVVKAEQEFSLEKILNSKVLDVLKKTEVKLMEYAPQQTWLLEKPDDIQLLLDDLLSLIQSLKQSPFLRNLKRKVEEVERKLMGFQDLLQCWKRCQRAWMYLEPIFVSDDLKKNMPLEKKLFDSVNSSWKEIMGGVHQEPFIFETLDWERVKADLTNCNRDLDNIKKCLNDYLEEKRADFQRFYFLSDEELIEIISRTKDPTLVTKYLNKCFDAIENIEFDDRRRIVAFLSKQGERVQLVRPINVEEGDKKGNVEKWLKELEGNMKNTLRKLTTDAIKDLNRERTEWLMRWPGQIVLMVNLIRWTSNVEQAIQDKTLQRFQALSKEELARVVDLVRGEIGATQRITLSALVTTDVHSNHLVEKFIDKNLRSTADFSYISQLRYYLGKKDTVHCRMMTADYKYQYEYLGNTRRLVITPLTDRCFRTLIEAYNYFYGGAPEGPAGTGKTETVKELAKAVAVKCNVFNCTDQINYVAMSKIFKGLAQTGSWCCFDEFNLIAPEVLSVIAEQVRTIQNAIKEKQNRFFFEGKNILLVRSCSINITMNPGYTGRSALPDNLKALFRPCAMMIPNYSLIAEISLYSAGFHRASELSVKIVNALTLSSEQLSTQKHYDFGMRNLNAILLAAGNEKRRNPEQCEFQLCLKALLDVNMPKFTRNDTSLFKSITADLFPDTESPKMEYKDLLNATRKEAEAKGLISFPSFTGKCIELFETLSVRHGLMMVGQTFSGKTKVLQTLQKALGINYKIDVHTINPKAVTRPQLYGSLNPDNNVWTDGVFTTIMKLCESQADEPEHKWLVFDGPVEAGWIESMNTLLDDSMMLCLTNGQKIKVTDKIRIMFEVEDLIHASLATVSRCGMVYMQPEQLGWSTLVSQFIQYEMPVEYPPHLKQMFQAIFEEFNRELKILNLKELVTPFVGEKNSFIKIKKKPKDILNLQIKLGLTDESNPLSSLSKSSVEPTDVTSRIDQIMRIPLFLGKEESIFNLMYITSQNCWAPWKEHISEWNPKDFQSMRYEEIIVPTIDTIRNQFFMEQIIGTKQHFLLTGPTGTAKSVGILSVIEQKYSGPKIGNFVTNFSGQTTAFSVQNSIQEKMTTRKGKKGYYGPEGNKEMMLVFIDDVNMPAKEECGAQPPVELLRMWLDHSFWYDLENIEEKFLVDMQLVCTMGPPSTGRNSVTDRFLSHFFTLYTTPFGTDSLQLIFESLLDWHFAKVRFPVDQSILDIKSLIVRSTIKLYDLVKTCKELLPTPKKSHYFYNLRDLSKVIQTMTKVDGRGLQGSAQMLKLWAHECTRVFMDRLESREDRNVFQKLLEQVLLDNFGFTWKELTKNKPILWGDFLPLLVSSDQGTKTFKEVYHEFNNPIQLEASVNRFLKEYNESNESNEQMNLILFKDAIEHVVKILRIIKTPNGHCLLVGMGGLGRGSLTCLSAFIAEYKIFSIEVSKDYSYNKNWVEDLQNLMKLCGFEDLPTVFIFRDSQIFVEEVLEDISTILNKGAVASVFNAEDKSALIDSIGMDFPNETGHLSASEKFEFFLSRCRENLHLSLCFSPVDKQFRSRLRNFPSLINCSSFDWFLEWPKEALHSVAVTVLGDGPRIKNEISQISQVFVQMHEDSKELSKKYQEELRKFYYVTPTSYLELLQIFQGILKKRTASTSEDIQRYEIGVEKLRNSKIEVQKMKQAILEMEPKLKQATIETEKLIVEVQSEQKEVDAQKDICQREEAECNRNKEEANALKVYCQSELKKVEPILEEATKSLSKVNRTHVDFIKKIQKVRPPIEKLFQSLCILLPPGEIPKKKDPKDPYKKIFDWATPTRNIIMAKPEQMIQRLKSFDAKKIDELDNSTISQLKNICANKNFALNQLEKVSSAAGAIGKFVHAVVEIHEKLQIINPKRQDLRDAEQRLEEAEAKLEAKNKEYSLLISKINQLKGKFEDERKKKENYEKEIAKCKKQLGAAEQLVVGLEIEKINWESRLENLKSSCKTMLGDVLLSAGIIAYLGVFPIQYREDAIMKWLAFIQSTGIQVSQNFKLKKILSDELTIGEWLTQHLPNDDFSIDNAIIMSNSRRFPLFVDPQGQAITWIKTMEKERLRVIKPTMESFRMHSSISNCLELGIPLLYENAGNQLDLCVVSLLENKRRIIGKTEQIKLQNRWVTVAPGFRFYITTKLTRPHYGPEVCVLVTMLNFQVTTEGLEDQLLNVLVSRKEPNTEKARLNNIREFHELKRKQKETEEKILTLLFTKDSNLLEDIILIATLEKSKKESQDARVRLKEIENMKVRLSNIRNLYKPVAFQAAHLFFCVMDLANVGPMYQFSLDWFVGLYRKSIDAEPTTKSSKVNDINKTFLSLLFSSVSSSLFEKDKLLFVFLIFMKLQFTQDLTSLSELRLFLVGPTRAKPRNENFVMSILSDKQFAQIEELAEEIPIFADVLVNMTNHPEQWTSLMQKEDLMDSDLLKIQNVQKMSTVQRLIFMRVIRPDRMIHCIRNSIRKFLGPEFLDFPQSNLANSFLDSSPQTPLILVLSPGSDPLKDIKKLAKDMAKGIVVKILSLGQGQENNANNFIKYAMEKGEWVVLQNCHLSYRYLPTIEKLLENEESHEDFRLWLTSIPSDKFPVTILQNGIKITNEPPQGLRANTLKNFNTLNDRDFEDHIHPMKWKKLLYSVILFHSVIQERRKYSSLGWNIPYEFSQNDLTISMTQLKSFLADFAEVPWKGLQTCIADLNYGGRVTDIMDTRLIRVILKSYLNPDVLSDSYRFSKCGSYSAVADSSLEDFKQRIKTQFPLEDEPTIFGLHSNANIVVGIKASQNLLETTLQLLPRDSSQMGSFNDQRMVETCENFLIRIPPLFNLETVKLSYPIEYDNSMNTVLQQELLRYNALTQVMMQTLKQVIQAVNGHIVMSTELEQILDRIYDNRVPFAWKKCSYPSLKPLSSWFEDYLRRIKFMQTWIDEGHPKSYWISGFFFTQSFLTGTKQDFSRKKKIPIDQVDFEYELLPTFAKDREYIERPEVGNYIYGLYMEGAQWDKKGHSIIDSTPRVLFTEVPIVWIKPVLRSEKKQTFCYDCPVYQTSSRSGSLTTTGHSSNYVMSLEIPIPESTNQEFWMKRGVACLCQLDD